MRLKYLFFLHILLVSCNHKQSLVDQTTKNHLIIFFTEQSKKRGENISIDSLKITWIDTLTKRDFIELKLDSLKNLLFTGTTVIKEADISTFNNLITQKTENYLNNFDSITPVFYRLICSFNYHRNDMSVNIGNEYAFLSPEMKILRSEDLDFFMQYSPDQSLINEWSVFKKELFYNKIMEESAGKPQLDSIELVIDSLQKQILKQ